MNSCCNGRGICILRQLELVEGAVAMMTKRRDGERIMGGKGKDCARCRNQNVGPRSLEFEMHTLSIPEGLASIHCGSCQESVAHIFGRSGAGSRLCMLHKKSLETTEGAVPPPALVQTHLLSPLDCFVSGKNQEKNQSPYTALNDEAPFLSASVDCADTHQQLLV